MFYSCVMLHPHTKVSVNYQGDIYHNIDGNVFSSLVDPTGKVHSEITNKNGNPNYKYFYSNADQGKKF